MEQGLEPREQGLEPRELGMGLMQAVEQVLMPAMSHIQGLVPRELGLAPKGPRLAQAMDQVQVLVPGIAHDQGLAPRELGLAPKGQGLVPAIAHDQGLAPMELGLAPLGPGLALAADHRQGQGPAGVHDQELRLEPLLGPGKAGGQEQVQAISCLSQALVLAQELPKAPHVLGLAPKEQGLGQSHAEMLQEPKVAQPGAGQGLGQGQEALGH